MLQSAAWQRSLICSAKLAQHAAPDGDNALVGPVVLPAHTAASLPLAAPPALSKGWSAAVGRPTEAQHALALAALQAGESVALMGHGAAPHDDLLLVVLARLVADPPHSALWLAPNQQVLQQTARLLTRWQPGVRWQTAHTRERRQHAQLTLLTYDEAHRHVLRFADRAWRWLWPSLRLVALPALDLAHGALGGHLAWIVRRLERLTAGIQPVAALAPVAAADASLPRLVGRAVRIVASSAGPPTPTLLALWRTGPDRAATAAALGRELAQRQLALTVLGRDPAETAALEATLAPALAVGLPPEQARVGLVLGIPAAMEERQRLIRAGYRLLVLLVGDLPHEQLIAAQPELLTDCLPGWPWPRSNPVITATELACAASERPITPAEAQSWQVADGLRTLVDRGVLGSRWPRATSGSPTPAPPSRTRCSTRRPCGARACRWSPPTARGWRRSRRSGPRWAPRRAYNGSQAGR